MQNNDDDLFDMWDKVRGAICTAECALPFQMSEAMAALTRARKEMDEVIRARFLGPRLSQETPTNDQG